MDDYRNEVLDILDVYSRDNTTFLFVKAIRLLGFPGPASDRQNIDLIVDSASIVNVDMKRIPLSLDGKKLYPIIRSAVSEYKNKPNELDFFIRDVISKFGGISDLVYPNALNSGYNEQIAAYTLLKSTEHYNPADSVLDEWRKYEYFLKPGISTSILDTAVNYRLELFHKYMSGDIHGRVQSIIGDMRTVAGMLDAALLENDCEKDFFYYQEQSKVILTYELDEYDRYSNSTASSSFILGKLADRSFYKCVPPSGLILPELRDEIYEYRHSGVWNMTRPVYSKVIAAPSDIREFNLEKYLTTYQRFVYTTNDYNSIRNLGPLFKDLFDEWGESAVLNNRFRFVPYPCWDMSELFSRQVINHVAYVYYVYLITNQGEYVDLERIYPGIEKKDIEQIICDERRLMSHESFAENEKRVTEYEDHYEPFPGFYYKNNTTTTAESKESAALEKARLGEKEYTELTVMFEGKPDTIDSLNYVDLCGVREIDRLFVLDYEDNPQYTAEDFNADLVTFTAKCKALSESDTSDKKKEVWIANILNVLLECYCAYAHTEKKDYLQYVIQFAAKLDSVFMKIPEQICVKRIAQEIGDPLIFQEPTPNFTEESEKNRIEAGLEVRPWEDDFLFEDFGPSLTYHQRRLCRDCKTTNCKFRFGLHKYFWDVDYDFGANKIVEQPDDSDSLEENSAEEAPLATPIPERIQEHFEKAKLYFKDGKWHNDDRMEFSIFMKALSCKVFHREWDGYAKWKGLPIPKLQDGTQLTVNQIKGTLRGYSDTVHDGIRRRFQRLLL